MTSFGKAIRNRLPAIGLGLVSAFGIVAVTSAVVAPAYAQAKVSREFGEPFTQARDLITAKNYTAALPLIEKAAPHAADNGQKLAIEQLRTAVYAGTKNNPKLVSSLEAQLRIGGLDSNMTKSHKATIAGLYSQMGQESKAEQLTKEYVDQYGGSSQQYAYLASSAVKAEQWSSAKNYASKAIQQAASESKAPRESWYNVLLKANYESGDMDGYYNTMEDVVLRFPKDAYWKQIIQGRTERASKVDRQAVTLDIFRAMLAAGVTLTDTEKLQMAEQALIKGQGAEGVALLKPLFETGKLGGADDKNAARNKSLYDRLVAIQKEDAEGGLADSIAEADSASSGTIYVSLGESYMGMGDYAKAVEMTEKGIAKGGLEPGEVGLAQLHLGMAQFKAGDKAGARKTWGAITADNGAKELGRAWTVISRK